MEERGKLGGRDGVFLGCGVDSGLCIYCQLYIYYDLCVFWYVY